MSDYRRFVELFKLAGVQFIEGTMSHGKTITVMNKYGDFVTYVFDYDTESFVEVA